jgi:hypothetical protein
MVAQLVKYRALYRNCRVMCIYLRFNLYASFIYYMLLCSDLTSKFLKPPVIFMRGSCKGKKIMLNSLINSHIHYIHEDENLLEYNAV